jgi:Glucose / Sorbosone dehydrogenase
VKRALAALVALLSFLLAASAAQAITLQQIGKFEQPIYVTSDPGHPNRLFVVERAGRIELVQEGGTTVFADLSPEVSCCGGEQGLLSIALAPGFDSSGRLFVDYIGKEPEPEIHVAELVASGDTAPLSSLRQILTIPHPHQSNHYGGQLQFGPEGDLFISTGDGGGGNDQEHNSQNLAKPLGKLLRLDPEPEGVLPYTVPADNPFAGAGGYEALVWSYGLRNPFRFSFDRDGSALMIGDVGQGAREEVDRAPAPEFGRGWNYGWNCREGTIAGPGDDEGCGERAGTFIEPIFDYEHDEPPGGGATRCAIIGGYVVHDPGLGSTDGRYLYGDNCSPGIRSIEPTAADPYATDRSEGIAVSGITSFGEDSCGRIYATSGNGPVYRLVGAAPTDCTGTAAGGGGGTAGGGGQSTRSPSWIDISARRRTAKRGGRASLTVKVSPCPGRQGEMVTLRRGVRTNASRRLDQSCTVRFYPWISARSAFRASIGADSTYLAATSRKLRITIAKPRRR